MANEKKQAEMREAFIKAMREGTEYVRQNNEEEIKDIKKDARQAFIDAMKEGTDYVQEYRQDEMKETQSEFSSTVEKLKNNFSDFAEQIKNGFSEFTKKLEVTANNLIKVGIVQDTKITDDAVTEEIKTDRVTPQQQTPNYEKSFEAITKVLSEINDSIITLNNNIIEGLKDGGMKPLSDNTVKETLKDTIINNLKDSVIKNNPITNTYNNVRDRYTSFKGGIKNSIANKFNNNPIAQGFYNVKNAYNALRGMPTTTNPLYQNQATAAPKSLTSSTKEQSQAQIIEEREKIEREEYTNELLEKILEALTGKKKEPKDKNKKDSSEGILSKVMSTGSTGLPLLDALLAGTLGAYLKDLISKIFTGMKKGIGGIVTKILPKLTKLLGAAGLIGSIISLVVDGIAGYFSADDWATSKISATLGGILGGTDKGMWGSIFNGLKWGLIGLTLGGPIGGIAGLVVGGILGYIGGEAIAKFIDDMTGKLGPMWTELSAWFATKWEMVTTWVKDTWNDYVVKPFDDTVSALGKAFEGFPWFSEIGTFFNDSWDNWVVKPFDETTEELGKFFKDFTWIDNILTFFKDSWNEWIVEPFNKMSAKFEKIIDSFPWMDEIGTFFSDTWKKYVSDPFDSAIETVKEAFKDFPNFPDFDILNTIGEKFMALKQLITDFVNKIPTSWNELKRWWNGEEDVEETTSTQTSDRNNNQSTSIPTVETPPATIPEKQVQKALTFDQGQGTPTPGDGFKMDLESMAKSEQKSSDIPDYSKYMNNTDNENSTQIEDKPTSEFTREMVNALGPLSLSSDKMEEPSSESVVSESGTIITPVSSQVETPDVTQSIMKDETGEYRSEQNEIQNRIKEEQFRRYSLSPQERAGEDAANHIMRPEVYPDRHNEILKSNVVNPYEGREQQSNEQSNTRSIVVNKGTKDRTNILPPSTLTKSEENPAIKSSIQGYAEALSKPELNESLEKYNIPTNKNIESSETDNQIIPLENLSPAPIDETLEPPKFFLKGDKTSAINKAIDLIGKEEGFVSEPMDDLSGNGARAIGYGFNFIDGKPVAELEQEALANNKPFIMTEDKAKEILKTEVNNFHNNLLNLTKRIEGKPIGEIYKEVSNPNRVAALISLAYQTGIGEITNFENMWTNIKKANESNSSADWEAAGREIVNSKAQRQLQALQDVRTDETGNRIYKETRLDRAEDIMSTGQLVSPAKAGYVSYGPTMLLTGEYPNAKQNPELTAPINFIRDEMVDSTENIVKRISETFERNENLKEIAMEQRLMKMFEKTGQMEERLKKKDNLETTKSQLNAPIVNNIVDNKQINNSSQSVLMKQTAHNPQNVFRLS